MPTSFFSPSFAPIKGAATSETAPAKNPLPTDLSALAAPAFASFGFLKLQWEREGGDEGKANDRLQTEYIYIRHTAQLEIDVATLHTFIYSILLIVHVRLRAGRGKHDHNNNRIAEIYIIILSNPMEVEYSVLT